MKFKSEKLLSENIGLWTYITKALFFCYAAKPGYLERAFLVQLNKTAGTEPWYVAPRIPKCSCRISFISAFLFVIFCILQRKPWCATGTGLLFFCKIALMCIKNFWYHFKNVKIRQTRHNLLVFQNNCYKFISDVSLNQNKILSFFLS